MSQNKNNSDLDSNILFEGVDPKVLKSFANPKNTIGKKEGSVIYQKGDLAEYLYLLIEGSVKLKYREPDGTNIYINKSANSFFGETELLGKTQRKSSAIADTGCRMYTFNLSELKILVKKDKQILKNLYNHKTFDFLEQDFVDATQDFLDPETDLADLIKNTTEKLPPKNTSNKEETQAEKGTFKIEETQEEEKLESGNEGGVFDKIITKEEIEESQEQNNNDSTENNITEDKTIAENEENVFNKTTTKEEVEESEEQAGSDLVEDNIIEEEVRTESDGGTFDKIITEEETEGNKVEEDVQEDAPIETEKFEEEQLKDELEESEGFVINDSSGFKFVNPGETLNTFVQEKPEQKPMPKINEEIEGKEITGNDTESFHGISTEEETVESKEQTDSAFSENSITEEKETAENKKTSFDKTIEVEKSEEDNTKIVEPEKPELDFSDYYETLLEATRTIFSKITVDETAETIAEAASKLVNAAGGVLYLVDKESEELRAKVLSENSIKDITVKFSDGLQGTAITEKKSIIAESPKDDKNFNPVIEDLTGIKIKNVIYYPVVTKSEEPIAVLELYNSEREKFDSREIELLNAISPSILKALSNAKYVDVLVQQRKILALGEITGFINEDIKNSLHKVKHYSSLIKKKKPSSDIDKLLDLQKGQINSIEDFLRFTDAYSHGKNIAQQNTIKVSEAVTQILNFLAEYVDSRNTVIYKKIGEDTVISVDLPSMYFVCYQIAKNACDAMNDDGKIYVTTEKDGDYIKIKFRDTGPGISETIKDKLFKPFLSYGKKQKPGLGLAISEKIISDQGGYIMTESVLGEGATLIIALPIVF